MELDHTLVGIAGEFFVLSQLTLRGYVATLTFGNTKSVDILVANQDLNRMFKVEVKTTIKKPGRDLLFSKDPVYKWAMSKKHEQIRDQNLVYCFVHVSDVDSLPQFFIVPSVDVADYVAWQHQHWLQESGGKDSDMRVFRIDEADPKGYRNNWRIFG
jgi:hypothetical protein